MSAVNELPSLPATATGYPGLEAAIEDAWHEQGL